MKLAAFTLGYLFVPLTSQAQTREIYTNANFRAIAQNHKVLAIFPFKTTLQLRPKEVEKNGRPAGVAILEKREGLAVQSAMHSYFLKRKESRDLSIDVQDPNRKNSLPERNGITYETQSEFSPSNRSNACVLCASA